MASLILNQKLDIPIHLFGFMIGVPLLGFSIGLFFYSGMMGKRHKSADIQFVPLMSPMSVLVGVVGSIASLYLIGWGLVRLFR